MPSRTPERHRRDLRVLMRALLATGLLVALYGTGIAMASDDPVFVDTEGRGHEEAVQALAVEGVVVGCQEQQFCPDEQLTRGQFASMVTAALGLDPLEQGPFEDLDGDVHAQNVNAIAEAGIVDGCGDDAFCSGAPITREQLASMLVEAFELPETDGLFFDDGGVTHGANVQRLAAAGLTAGCGDPLTHYCSGDPLLRWEAATFLARALDLVERVELAPLEERREEQARIDAERQARLEAEREAQRQQEEQERLEREKAAQEAARLAMWESLAECESNRNWQINTGNGFYGGLQFMLETWQSVGGSGYPHQASKEEQIYRAELLLQKPWATFSNQWPACSQLLGLG